MKLIRSLASFSPLIWRAIVLSLLGLLPVLLYVVLGAVLAWQSGQYQWVLWSAPVLWFAAWIVSRIWRPHTQNAPESRPQDAPLHWTPRDQTALSIVTEYQQRVTTLQPGQLTDPQFYLQTAQELSRDIARHYHPGAADPVSSLTVAETLAALRLVIDDLERWMLDAVPGSQLLTIGQWHSLRHAPKWWNRVSNARWIAAIMVNPASALSYLASRYTLEPITLELQQELLGAVYLKFIRESGRYLIELNSGRLRGGADEYRRRFESAAAAPEAGQNRAAPFEQQTTLLLIGQAKAGKSSLVNALLGEQASAVDVLPCTDELTRYQLSSSQWSGPLEIIDSPGYAETGLTRAQRSAIEVSLRDADILLLVMAAHQPAREADRAALAALQEWYDAHPELKPPAIIAVLTHIDRLSPSLEWSPPYDWREPHSKKEHSIRGALDYVIELFGSRLTCAVPVRTDAGHIFGIEDELLPAIAATLGEARANSLLRSLFRQLSQERLQKLCRQALASGNALKELWKEWVRVRRRRS